MLEGKRQKIETPSAAEILSPMLTSTDIRLRTDTYEKARRAAPGLDVYSLEQDWLEWIAKTGKVSETKEPDAAFIGFCKRKGKQHGQT
jgi:hypothetical protein